MPKRVVNTFFDGKPEWFSGYAMTIVEFLTSRDVTTVGYSVVASDLTTHMENCSITEIWDIDEQSESEYTFDTFDSDRSYPTIYVSASFSCKCGKYDRQSVSKQTSIAELLHSALRKD